MKHRLSAEHVYSHKNWSEFVSGDDLWFVAGRYRVFRTDGCVNVFRNSR